MDDAKLETLDIAVDTVRPEAKEYVQSLDAIRLQTTKDNYGQVMTFLSKLQKDVGTQMAAIFLIAMVEEGYPLVTAQQLRALFGWPAVIDQLLSRSYLKVGA